MNDMLQTACSFTSISCCWDTHTSSFHILLVSSGSSTRSKHPHTPFKPVVATTCNANSASVWGGVFLSLWFGFCFWFFSPPFFWRQVNISARVGHADNSVSQLTGDSTRAKHCVTVPHTCIWDQPGTCSVSPLLSFVQ